jgi:hypothetical protein
MKSKFAEMLPIFKNVEVSRDDIGDHMRQYAVDHDIMSQPRKSLVGSMFGEKIMVISPLLKWYVEHGLKVTQIHQVVEYTPATCFQKFGEQVSEARRAGDAAWHSAGYIYGRKGRRDSADVMLLTVNDICMSLFVGDCFPVAGISI